MNARSNRRVLPPAPCFVDRVSAPFGAVAAYYFLEPRFRVQCVQLPGGKRPGTGARPRRCARLHRILAAFPNHPPEDAFCEQELLPETISPFRRAVLMTLHRETAPGTVVTYERLARLCGRNGAARAVGTAMAANPVPLFIPCHRVVRSDGTPGCFQGGTGRGARLKRTLLSLEGIRFDEKGRIPGRHFL